MRDSRRRSREDHLGAAGGRLHQRPPEAVAGTSALAAGVELSKRRVVVTGLGTVCPVGNTRAGGLVEYHCGQVRHHPDHPLSTPVPSRRRLRARSRASTSTQGALGEGGAPVRRLHSLRDGGGDRGHRRCRASTPHPKTPSASAINIGSGIGGLPTIEETHNDRCSQGGPRKISPFFIPGAIINSDVRATSSIMFGFKGPNLAMVTACTTANHCIGEVDAI